MFSPPDNIVKVLSLYSEKASLINGLFIYTFIYAIVFYVFVVLCTCVFVFDIMDGFSHNTHCSIVA